MSIISESVTKGYVMILCGGRSGSIMYQGKESRFDDLLCKTLCVYWIKLYLSCCYPSITKATTQNSQVEEMHRARYGGRQGASLPFLGVPPFSTSLWSLTRKLSEPCCLVVFMEVLLRRHD